MEKALKFLKHMKQTDTPYNFRECELDEAIAELEAINLTRREWYQKGFNEAMKPKTCEWKYENSTDMWVGACGAEMVFYNNLTPTQEKMHFCYKCGKNIIEIEPKATT